MLFTTCCFLSGWRNFWHSKCLKDKELYEYGVYQIEADGRSLFAKIEGDEDTIMGLPIKQVKEYLNTLK